MKKVNSKIDWEVNLLPTTNIRICVVITTPYTIYTVGHPSGRIYQR